MKFLCICRAGHSRSVALARALHARNHEAVPVGGETSPSSIAVIGAWADKIFVVDCPMSQIPVELHSKCVDFYIGHDRWVNPYHPELAEIWGKKLDAIGIVKI